jgi:hypothetical protein
MVHVMKPEMFAATAADMDQGTYDVRYAFNTGRTADIAGSPSRAISGSGQPLGISTFRASYGATAAAVVATGVELKKTVSLLRS